MGQSHSTCTKEQVNPLESESDDLGHACIRRIFQDKQKEKSLERGIEWTENRLGPKVSGDMDVGSLRGEIYTFSRGSRSRFKKRLAEMPGDYFNIWFDLTFPDEVMSGKSLEERCGYAGEHMNRLNSKGLWSRFDVRGYWKKELMGRKSGSMIGELVPHFHCPVRLNADQESLEAICKAILRSHVGSMRLEGKIREKALSVALHENSWRKITDHISMQRYTSKYVTKEEDAKVFKERGLALGRFWGKIGRVEEDRLPVRYHCVPKEEDEAWKVFWSLVADLKAQEWMEYEGELEEDRVKRLEKHESFLERVRLGKCYVLLDDAGVKVGDLYAKALAKVKECPF